MKITPADDPRSLRIAILGSTYPRSEMDHEVPWLRESVKRLAARGYKVVVLPRKKKPEQTNGEVRTVEDVFLFHGYHGQLMSGRILPQPPYSEITSV